jgi:hypothetical protein
MKTIFFGPFIGEFGWEILWWQGWVRRVCLNEFKDYRKIVSSFPGRSILYPYADDYWPHPEHIEKLNYSQRNYMADYWIGKEPSGQKWIYKKRFFLFERPKKVDVSDLVANTNVGQIFEELLETYKKRLPKDAVYFVPFKPNYYENTLEFGIFDYLTAEARQIPFASQRFERIMPDNKGNNLFKEYLNGYQNRMISIFPRKRIERRSDKNWPKKEYDRLIGGLKRRFPSYKIAVLGEPKGAYYTQPEAVLEGVFDAVNFPAKERLRMQVAILNNSRFALGGMSGAILFSLMSGCPTLAWGTKTEEENYYYENVLNTKFYYYPILHCRAAKILSLVKKKGY